MTSEEFLEFVGGSNAVLIENEQDFNEFVKTLQYHHVSKEVLGVARKGNVEEYDYWLNLASINKKKNDGPEILFEYNSGKGLSISFSLEEMEDWYGKEPIRPRR